MLNAAKVKGGTDIDEALDGCDGDDVEERQSHKCAPYRHKAKLALPTSPPVVTATAEKRKAPPSSIFG